MENDSNVEIKDYSELVKFIGDKFEDVNKKIDDTKFELKKEIHGARDWTTEKVNDLKGDFVLPLKREDEKLEKTVDRLAEKKVFNSKDIKEIKSIEVFAKVA